MPLFTRANLRQLLASNLLVASAIFLLALVLRVSLLNVYGLWSDEVESIAVARAGLNFIFDGRSGWIANQTVPFYILMWGVIQPFDPATTAVLVRLPSALAGALLVFPVFGLGNLLFNRATAIVASLAVALSPILLDYSLDLRPYSLVAFFTVTAVYCLVMADRTNSPRWWVGFVVAILLDLMSSYMAIILVLPSLAPYIAFLLWTTWSRRRRDGRPKLLYAICALAVVGAFAVFMLLDLLRVSHARPDLSELSLNFITSVFLETAGSFVNIGIPARFGNLLSLILVLVVIFGVYVGVRTGKGKGVLLSAGICTMSSLLLSVMATASIISPRYVLFAVPFYMLLLAYGIMEIPHLVSLVRSMRQPASSETTLDSAAPALDTRPLSTGSLVLAGLVVVMMAVGFYNYISPATHSSLSYKPDFRGAAEFLSQAATPQDIIIVADDPSLGYGVTNFYLKSQPPAPMFDMRDPLLYREKPVGSIYWVITSMDGNITQQLSNPDPAWSKTVQLEGVIVLKQEVQGLDMAGAVEQMAAKMEAIHPKYQPIRTLGGVIKQARGDVAGAAQAYKSAGTYFALSSEYLSAARSFDTHGFKAEAWRQALVARFMESYKPEVHTWFGEQLQASGYPDESRIELQIAQALSSP